MRTQNAKLIWTLLCLFALHNTGIAQEPAPSPLETSPVKSEKKLLCDQETEEKVRSGVLNASLLGTSGLFSIFDAETLYCKTYLISPSFETLGRPGRVRVSQLHITGAFGLTDRLELFASTTPFQYVNVGSPNQLSGSLLNASLQRTTLQSSSRSLLNNRTNGFYRLPGLDVSGALVGGLLPGVPQGNSQQITDPILMRQKAAFSTPAFLNDLPFLGRSGSAFGDALTVGAKYRFSVVNEKNPASKFFSSSILGYVKFPSHYDGGFINSPSNNGLVKGSGSGTIDFGVFLVGSFYLPTVSADAGSSGQSGNTNTPGAKASPIKTSYFETLNHHVNLGFIRHSDPSTGGARLIDRKDAFVVGYGLDAMLNRYAQAIGELRHERLIGGGTPNLIKHNPLDVSFGLRLYPGGLPQFKEVKEGKVRSAKLWSLGFAYRLELGRAGSFASIGSSRHNFLVQLSFGRTRLFGGLGPKCPEDIPCDNEKRAILSDIRLKNSTIRRGEIVSVLPQYRSGEFTKHDLVTYIDDQITRNENLDEDGDPVKAEIKFTANLRPRREPYKVKVRVRTAFEQTILERPECPLTSVVCSPSEAVADLYVTNTAPTLTLLPPRIGPISAQTAQTLSLTAAAEDKDQDPVSLSWSAPPEIVLSGSNNDSTRTFSTNNLRAGEHYRVSVRASDGTESVEQSAEVIVNNPPTVGLRTDHPNLQGVTQGEQLNLIAEGRDLDNDQVTYEWRLSGITPNSQIDNRKLLADKLGASTLMLSTQDLEPGRYTVAVTTSDSVDTSTPARLGFEVVRRAPQIFFDFDKYLLRWSERQKLDEESLWLSSDFNRTIEIRCEGNADLIGSPSYNLRLGCRRACTAKAYLMSKGISADRIGIAISFGEKNADQQRQRSSDRRVDLTYSRRAGEVDSVPARAEACNCSTIFKASKKSAKVKKHKRTSQIRGSD